MLGSKLGYLSFVQKHSRKFSKCDQKVFIYRFNSILKIIAKKYLKYKVLKNQISEFF